MRCYGIMPVKVDPRRVAVTGYFVLYGVVLAVWVTRIPAIKQHLGLSDGLLGAALLGLPAGVLLITLVAGRLVDRAGSARVTRAGGVAMPLLLIPPSLAGGVTGLIGSLLTFGIAAGALNVGMNANGVLVERASGRRVMTSLHAGYSLGALAGAVAGGLFARAGASPLTTFVATALPCAGYAAVAGRWLLTETRATGAGAAGAGAAAPASGTAAGPATAYRGPGGGRHALRPGPLILLLGLTGLCALLAEGAAADWSAVYLRDNLGTSAGLAAAGFAAFSIAMAASRLLGDRLAARFGPAALVRASGVTAAAGLAAGLLIGAPAAAIAGFAVLGAGLACIAPQVFLAAGHADPARPGHGLARVVGLSYLGMVGGPAVIGAVASITGLPLALGIPVLLALCVAALAWAVGVPSAPGPRAAAQLAQPGRTSPDS
jgi:predicted MFS family arabinose efflux permease